MSEENKKEKMDYLCLKFGSLKEWSFHSKKAKKLLNEFSKIGIASGGLIMHENTNRQKEIICELIDEGNFNKVFLDWDGKFVSKERAKKYITNYGSKEKKQ